MEQALCTHGNKFHASGEAASEVVPKSGDSLAIARQLMEKKRYTLALHMYVKAAEPLLDDATDRTQARNIQLADQMISIFANAVAVSW